MPVPRPLPLGIKSGSPRALVFCWLLSAGLAGCGGQAQHQAPKASSRFAAPATAPAGPSATAPSAATPACPIFDPVPTEKHLRNAIERLMTGEETTAREELRLALCQVPDDETARSLSWQLDAIPEEVLGTTFFLHTIREGDSLPRLAKESLGDPYRFYLLAKYNQLEQAGRLRVGQCLKIPGPAPAEEADLAEQLYRCGNEELAAGDSKRAHGFFRQLLEIDPTHAEAQARTLQIAQQALEAYRKEVVAAFRKQDLQDALKNCGKMLEIDPSNLEAKTLLQEACDMRDRLVALLYEEAQAALARQDQAEALANCDKVLELAPGHPGATALRVQAEAL